MSAKVFIDGQEGTTGLAIHQHLTQRDDLEILEIESELRKDDVRRGELFQEADLGILCLPDDAAKQAPEIAGNTRLLDASTAHRVSADWVYGLPELASDQRKKIANAQYVANPGCYPTGFLLLVRPLVDAGFLSEHLLVKVNAVSGYSGGGKKLIAEYEPDVGSKFDTRSYGLDLNHKHLPEMKHYGRLKYTPLFTPSVGPFRQGMLVQIPLGLTELSQVESGIEIVSLYKQRYEHEQYINVHEFNDQSVLDSKFLNATELNGTNFVDLLVFGNDLQVILIARLDNLGKGASIAAVQNMNLMLGLDESTGIPTRKQA